MAAPASDRTSPRATAGAPPDAALRALRRHGRARRSSAGAPRGACGDATIYALDVMPQSWVWMQVAIVVFVVIGMIVAITKLA